MFTWPNLELTDYERKFVRLYKTKDKPGVLKRVYRRQLTNTALPNKNLPVVKLSEQIQISRRSRVFAICFSGDIGSWRLQITNASGTNYTVKTPRTAQDPIVSSLISGSFFNAAALGGLAVPINLFVDISPSFGPNLIGGASQVALSGMQAYPWLIDPNWVLLPNETLIFNGTPIPVPYNGAKQLTDPPLVLGIAIHVWEFPVMGTAPAEHREVV